MLVDGGTQPVAVEADILEIVVIQPLELAERRIAGSPTAKRRNQPAEGLRGIVEA